MGTALLVIYVLDRAGLVELFRRSGGPHMLIRSILVSLPPALLFGALDGFFTYQRLSGPGEFWERKIPRITLYAWFILLIVASIEHLILLVVMLPWSWPLHAYVKQHKSICNGIPPSRWFVLLGFCFCVACFVVFVFNHGVGHLHDSIAASCFGSFWMGDAFLARTLTRWRKDESLLPSAAKVLQISLGSLLIWILGLSSYTALILHFFPL